MGEWENEVLAIFVFRGLVRMGACVSRGGLAPSNHIQHSPGNKTAASVAQPVITAGSGCAQLPGEVGMVENTPE